MRQTILLLIALIPCVGAHAQSKETLPQRLKKMIDSVNVDDNPKLEFPGEAFLDLPKEAVPLLKEAQKRKDLRWTARACVAKALRRIDERSRGLEWAQEFEDKRKEFRRITVEEYKRVSRHDPAWDEKALRAVEAALVRWGLQYRATEEDEKRAFELALAAVDAGCDDPLVLYILGRFTSFSRGGNPKARMEAHDRAADALEKSGYHPLLRFRGQSGAAQLLSLLSQEKISDEVRKKIQDRLALAIRFFEEAVASDKTLSPFTIVDMAEDVMDVWARLDDRRKAFDPMHAALAKAYPSSWLADVVAGMFWVRYAWDARGSGWAAEVKPEDWEQLRSRLKVAREKLTSAWKANPASSLAPRMMLSVVLADGSERDEMELWFTRALEAFPNDTAACQTKLTYLEPKWHGNPQEMLKFARQSALTGNWDVGLPLLIVRAHETLAQYSQEGWQPMPDFAYFRKPGIWEDLRTVYDRSFKIRPEAPAQRAMYAFYCAQAGKWKEAHEQFEILGPTPSSFGAFRNQRMYGQAREEAARHVQEK